MADEAYAEFVGRSVLAAPERLPSPGGDAHAEQGARARRASASVSPWPSRRPWPRYSRTGRPRRSARSPRRWPRPRSRRPELAAANVARIAEQRDRLVRDLAVIGWRPYPSQANFLLIPFGSSKEAHAAGEALLRRGLVPRTFGVGHPFANCLRLTVRSAAENDRLIDAARGIPA